MNISNNGLSHACTSISSLIIFNQWTYCRSHFFQIFEHLFLSSSKLCNEFDDYGFRCLITFYNAYFSSSVKLFAVLKTPMCCKHYGSLLRRLKSLHNWFQLVYTYLVAQLNQFHEFTQTRFPLLTGEYTINNRQYNRFFLKIGVNGYLETSEL